MVAVLSGILARTGTAARGVRICTVDYLHATPVAPGEAHLPQALT